MIVLKATQDKVLATLQSVAGIVERRHTLPILANVLIRKTGETVQLTTSDLEIQIRTSVALENARRWPSVATRLSVLPSATNRMPLR